MNFSPRKLRSRRKLSNAEWDDLETIFPNKNIHIGNIDESDPLALRCRLSSGQEILVLDRVVFIYYTVL